jgi:transposase
LVVAFELGATVWKLAAGVPGRPRIRQKTVAAGDLVAVLAWIGAVRISEAVGAGAPVWTCYEAGRDGFWLHRALEEQGLRNLVVDAASIEVPRRARRAKTDRLDAAALMRLLARHVGGERGALRVVQVPTEAEEDARAVHRELESVKRARGAVSNRIGSLLATQGVRVEVSAWFGAQLSTLCRWDGSPLPPQLTARLAREWAAYEALTARIRAVEAARREALQTATSDALEQVQRLMRLQAIGINSAWLFVFEFFGWRHFKNRRQVGALAGLTPTPWQSGGMVREQGMSGAGNRRVRTMAIEIAWSWLRFQPQSALAQWYQRRYGGGSKRLRRIGIVALARKLLIALWRYLEGGELPEGAALKAA